MVSRPSDLSALIDSVLEERAQAVSFSQREIDAQAAKLRAGFARVRENVAARQRVIEAMQSLPASRRVGWLEGVQSAVKVVMGEASRTSRILVDAASGLLPPASGGWTFAPAALAATRSGETAATRAESVDAASATSRTVIVDDAVEPRVLAIIDNHPADMAPPVLLIVTENGDPKGSPVIEVDPEIEADGAGAGYRRLRYEAMLPSGAYYLFFGNPRVPGR